MARSAEAHAADQTADIESLNDEQRSTAEQGISQFEFLGRVPTREQVVDLLAKLQPVFGVATVDFADYVQALPQKKTVKVPRGDRLVSTDIEAFTLYMSVAGRLKMLEQAAVMNGWSVEFRPEMGPGVAIPGFIDLGVESQRIVYREYLVISQVYGVPTSAADDAAGPLGVPLNEPVQIGSKPGMAWVPYSGGSNAKGSNPYEKVETAARGRAIAAWGFGVLPGSGIASLEEVRGAGENERALQQTAPQQQGKAPRLTIDEIRSKTIETVERARQIKQAEQDVMNTVVGTYIVRNIGAPHAYDESANVIHWDRLNGGQLHLVMNAFQREIEQAQALAEGATS